MPEGMERDELALRILLATFIHIRRSSHRLRRSDPGTGSGLAVSTYEPADPHDREVGQGYQGCQRPPGEVGDR
jgi:hypothetical protein